MESELNFPNFAKRRNCKVISMNCQMALNLEMRFCSIAVEKPAKLWERRITLNGSLATSRLGKIQETEIAFL